ncbi:type II toxin-antitoxin system VapC family toxin [Psychrobacter sp. I-STPA6b]|uniref:type II toxin-antitoxin system VapC family toxin n=1 Tax=Psychrobacter sp. I-STPA6b TaxID=2585718 RepID=UPI001D0C5C3D|nr:type II toxin-antitoxin system VapC family toxin [Psychrobacter sp. I-STPA6b]
MTGYLLDTHALIWWWTNPQKLSTQAFDIISNPRNIIFVSSASIWEMATKHRKGKLGEAQLILDKFSSLMLINNFKHMPINWQHAKLSGELPHSHSDPFDRMLVAQAKLENLALISCDGALADFDITLCW